MKIWRRKNVIIFLDKVCAIDMLACGDDQFKVFFRYDAHHNSEIFCESEEQAYAIIDEISAIVRGNIDV